MGNMMGKLHFLNDPQPSGSWSHGHKISVIPSISAAEIVRLTALLTRVKADASVDVVPSRLPSTSVST